MLIYKEDYFNLFPSWNNTIMQNPDVKTGILLLFLHGRRTFYRHTKEDCEIEVLQAFTVKVKLTVPP